MTRQTFLLIGNSDGIGAALTQRLLDSGATVVGLSRSPSPIVHAHYRHHVQDVAADDYPLVLDRILRDLPPLDACIYCAGIGDALNLDDLAAETRTFEVNLLAAVTTAERVVTRMRRQGCGHFIGLSSMADGFPSAGAPAYNASKAGLSAYLEGLGMACRRYGVHVSNVRFGFVDTKMAKSPTKPFLLTPAKAADIVLGVLKRPRLRVSRPRRMLPLVWLVGVVTQAMVLLA